MSFIAERGHATGCGEEVGILMRAESVLRCVAFGCAVFLLLGPFADRTTWQLENTTMTDAAGYNMVAFFSGVVVLAALAVALRTRRREVVPLLSAVVAIAAFGLTAYIAGLYWLARLRGEVYIYGVGGVLDGGEYAKVDPASGPPYFAAAAILGAVSTLFLVLGWLRQARGT